ncbi:MAG TPA: hypothetical protein VFZ53_04050 [Polyangiaceae bacterium]
MSCAMACSAEDEPSVPAALELTRADSGSTVTIEVRQSIDVRLQTVGQGRFETPVVSGAAVRFVRLAMDSAQNPSGPLQRCKFEGAEAGGADIEIPHSGESAPFTLHVVVE